MTATLANAPKQLDGLAPSCKLVWLVLVQIGPESQPALARHCRLPPRTVRQATTNLEESGLITERRDLEDARQKVYEARESAISGV